MIFLSKKDINELDLTEQEMVFKNHFLLESVTESGKAVAVEYKKGKKAKRVKKRKPIKGKSIDFDIPQVATDNIDSLIKMNQDLWPSAGNNIKAKISIIANGGLVFIKKDTIQG